MRYCSVMQRNFTFKHMILGAVVKRHQKPSSQTWNLREVFAKITSHIVFLQRNARCQEPNKFNVLSFHRKLLRYHMLATFIFKMAKSQKSRHSALASRNDAKFFKGVIRRERSRLSFLLPSWKKVQINQIEWRSNVKKVHKQIRLFVNAGLRSRQEKLQKKCLLCTLFKRVLNLLTTTYLYPPFWLL